jgi:hypothetical protein
MIAAASIAPASFLRWILPHAVACADTVAEAYVVSAARDFCGATRCWRETDTITLNGTEGDIVCVPVDATLIDIEQASIDGRVLDPVPYREARLNEEGLPFQITTVQPNAVRVAPRGAGQLTISMFLMPSQAAATLPHILFERWGEEIADGALGRILDIPNQPFTDPRAAADRRARFQAAKDRAFNQSIRGQHRGPARARPSFF